MCDDAAPEEGVLEVALGAVEELVRQHDVAGFVFRLQRADGADADDPVDAERFHRPEIGAVVQLAGEEPVAAGVAWEEDDRATCELAREEFIRGIAEGRLDLHPFLVGEALDVVKPAAANDADAMCCHAAGG